MQQKKNSNYEKVLSFTFIKIKLIKKVKTLFDSKFYADSEYVIVFYKNVNWIKKLKKNVLIKMFLFPYCIDKYTYT